MTVKAYVLMETVIGQEEQVKKKLDALEGVNSAEIVAGGFDIIAVITGDDMTAIGRIVVRRIRALPSVQRTVTCVVQPL